MACWHRLEPQETLGGDTGPFKSLAVAHRRLLFGPAAAYLQQNFVCYLRASPRPPAALPTCLPARLAQPPRAAMHFVGFAVKPLANWPRLQRVMPTAASERQQGTPRSVGNRQITKKIAMKTCISHTESHLMIPFPSHILRGNSPPAKLSSVGRRQARVQVLLPPKLVLPAD